MYSKLGFSEKEMVKMKYVITGKVQETTSSRGIPGIIMKAFDKDRLYDDLLGEAMTDINGNFRIEYDEKKFGRLFEDAPDIYITLKTLSGKVIYTTEGSVRFNAKPHEVYLVRLPAEMLKAAGLRASGAPGIISRETLTTLRNVDVEDDLVKQIKGDLEGKASILEMMKEYMMALENELDNNALPYRKLHRLFEIGSAPDCMDGHYYGVTIGLRTGGLRGVAAEYGNLLGYLWGAAIGGVCPWVGKTFKPMAEGDRIQVVGDTVPDDVNVYRGINHFNIIEKSPINVAANSLLTFMWQLKETPEVERLQYGHERNGGHFASYRAQSIYDKTPREVFSLNYRYSGLDNFPPLIYLIDELVEIADGLYLGQLLFATDRLLDRYDPKERKEIYRYHHFGYFLLFREDWNVEAKRLFPHLEMSNAAVTTSIVPSVITTTVPEKFTRLTLADPPDGDVDPALMNEIRKDLANSETIIHILKSYSDDLAVNPDTKSVTSRKLHTLFNAGVGPTVMDGFYRGALVWWQGEELLANVSSLTTAWQMMRSFSPWTGKRFYPITRERLLEITDGYEKMDVPTFWGTNTQVFRTAREQTIRKLMEIASVWVEEATAEERRLYGYHAHSFFFIGKSAESVMPQNKGKRVFQFNYRWKALRTPPPDNYCIDEIVQIAEGLYLGMLNYATNLIKPWDPDANPSEYRYKLFGYFLLMDEEWHVRRLRAGLDLDNV